MKWLFDEEIRHTMMCEIIAQSLAAQVVNLRIARGMNQSQFAVFLGMPQSQLARLETVKGMKNVSMNTLTKVAHKCEVALLCRFVDWRKFIESYGALMPPDAFNSDTLITK